MLSSVHPSTPEEYDSVTGLHKIDQAIGKKKGTMVSVGLCFGYCIFLAIGVGIAYVIYSNGNTESYDKKITAGKKAELCWVCFAVLILSFTILFLNSFPAFYKE